LNFLAAIVFLAGFFTAMNSPPFLLRLVHAVAPPSFVFSASSPHPYADRLVDCHFSLPDRCKLELLSEPLVPDKAGLAEAGSTPGIMDGSKSCPLGQTQITSA
jgi:hypothetical protein